MITTALGASVKGNFSYISADNVQFTIPSEGVPKELLARSTCVVHFGAGNSSHMFVARVVSLTRGAPGAPMTLATSVPTELSSVQQRNTYRVPVVEPGMLAVAVLVSGKPRSGRAIDVSMAGVQLAFPGASDPCLKLGESYSFLMSCAGQRLRIPGEVRRVGKVDGEARYGVFFIDLLKKDGTMKCPADLRRIVNFLERAWIKNRRR